MLRKNKKRTIPAQIRMLVAGDNLKEAFKLLFDTSFADEAILSAGRLEKLENDVQKGIISSADENLERNKLRDFLLKTAESLETSAPPSLLASSSPIKGLQAFEPADAELFKQLQREQEIDFFVQTFPHNDFAIGLLSGVSGAGKTSYLQAGVLPTLQELGYQVIYVKFSDIAPLESIRLAIEKALIRKLDQAENFLEFVRQTSTNSEKLIFLFDQFEQFFAHYRSKIEREGFLSQLQEWYIQRGLFSVKVLFSVRSDMIDFLYEIQETLGYDLSVNQNYFQLKKFTPEQATAIFKVIAENKAVDFDKKFVLDICTQELAAREDGLISAVDIQILAMMLDGQAKSGDRAFIPKAYQKMGGIEGLLQRFLKEQLDTPTIHNRDQAVLKVLLALADLDRNVRAGTLNTQQLQDKLQGVVAPDRIQGILEWLGSLRMVTKITQENQPDTYELVHERLIIPLRNVAGKTLSHIDNLSQLLDRRVNEWLGNQRQKRYLFNLWELFQIRRYQKLLSWEPKREQKEMLVVASRKVWQWRGAYVLSSFALVAVFALLLNTPYFLIQRIKYIHFPDSLEKASADEKQETAALLIDTHPSLAFQSIKSIPQKNAAFQAIIVALDSLQSNSTNQIIDAKKWLDLSIEYANTFESTYSRVDMLKKLAFAAGWLAKLSKEPKHLITGIEIAEKIEDDDERAKALKGLVLAAGELAKLSKQASYLTTGREIVEKLEYADERADALQSLALAAGELAKLSKQTMYLIIGGEIAKKIIYADNYVPAMRNLALAAGELAAPKLAKEFLNSAREVVENTAAPPRYCTDELRKLALAAGELAELKLAKEFLTRGREISEKIEEANYRADELNNLALAAGVLTETRLAQEYLTSGREIAEKIEDDDNRADALRNLALTAGELAKLFKQAMYLTSGREIAKKIEEASYRVDALRGLALAAGELAEFKLAKEFLTSGKEIAEKMENDYSQGNDLSSLVLVAGELAKLSKQTMYLASGREIVEKIENVDERVLALMSLALAAGELAAPKLAKEYLINGREIAEKIENTNDRVARLSGLALAAWKLSESKLAKGFLIIGRETAEKIEDNYSRDHALITLVQAAGVFAKVTKQTRYLTSGGEIVEKIENDYSRANALRTLTQAATELGLWRSAYHFAKETPEHQRIISYTEILHAWAKRHQSKSNIGNRKTEFNK